jgi:drug/metabolite transporter (DMT)-like permease
MQTLLLMIIAMLAFAANSLLCRLTLGAGLIDAASFTSVRMVSGALLAVISGAVASGLGCCVRYAALRGLGAGPAATVQLSVPVIAALGGVMLLDEAITSRLLISVDRDPRRRRVGPVAGQPGDQRTRALSQAGHARGVAG